MMRFMVFYKCISDSVLTKEFCLSMFWEKKKPKDIIIYYAYVFYRKSHKNNTHAYCCAFQVSSEILTRAMFSMQLCCDVHCAYGVQALILRLLL